MSHKEAVKEFIETTLEKNNKQRHALKMNLHRFYFQATVLFLQEHKVLLTGTPLQNTVEELFSLLHFLEPARFPSETTFMQEFGDLKTEEQVITHAHSSFPVQGECQFNHATESECYFLLLQVILSVFRTGKVEIKKKLVLYI